jgi:hypothetical protein
VTDLVVVPAARTVVREAERLRVLEVGTQGPPGPAGAGGRIHVHTQSVPASEWVVNHNLGIVPSVEVYVGGAQVLAEVVHVSADQARIYFAVATSGTALVQA